jgi:trehalose 2-sulfotransferase
VTQVASAGNRRRGGYDKVAAPADRALDFPRPVALRKSYIVASTPRSGGAFLCAQLWKTGVLGAPAEYLSYPSGRLGRRMAKRLEPSSHADYIAKVIACRTSKNGVFGVRVHFKDFRETLVRVPETLSMLAPATYIYVDRRDKLAQAVDLARAVQANRRVSALELRASRLRYDRNLISKCLGSLERARLDWTRWFESHGVDPLVVTYEDLAADKAEVVRSIVEFLGVDGDEPEEVRRLREFEPRADGVKDEWAARFEREIREGIRLRRA